MNIEKCQLCQEFFQTEFEEGLVGLVLCSECEPEFREQCKSIKHGQLIASFVNIRLKTTDGDALFDWLKAM